MANSPEVDRMASFPSPRILSVGVAISLALAAPALAQDGRAPAKRKPKATVERAIVDKPVSEKMADRDAVHFCAAVAPSITEARIAWQTKRLAELDAQLKQRIADLEKAESAARDWVARRDALMTAANDNLVAIFARMQAEAAARELSAMDDRMAAAILGKLKPNAAGAILDEMEAERASRLVGMLSALDAPGKKS